MPKDRTEAPMALHAFEEGEPMSTKVTKPRSAKKNGAHEAAMKDEDAIPGFDPDGLIGQLGDELLAEMKAARNLEPWEKLKQHEQQFQIDRAYRRARELVTQAARAIAAKGFPFIDGVIEEKGKWDGNLIQVTIAAAKNADNLAALSAGGRVVQLVLVSAEQFKGEMRTVAQKDQPDLLADDDTAEDDEGADPATGEIVQPKPVFDQTEAGART